ncbi:hypothetical protein CEH02_02825 [Streptococcus pyogenes]|uniref:Uncharacterized protein n=1 Tax=Streptococcus pyogenes serotype M12 (strain MGAS9429) TaxID=370551 RepID=Q1JN58_STRPC|nr:hypothetical protein MGAS9429_Spy0353 [Streptococcus pyogenes MGAS9429]ABF35421.1 hypothetical protein MGAS2096_Spy0369 [Streptococcus pyogenes MGAS2096]AYZ02311.1 hypothetical protein EGX78_02090 [Streptococcus pyogenes]OYN73819.1 hypothetical protein CE466_00095 [Streptococcus pyogenes]OZY74749.1 hypothetical protein CBG02_02825 [Streptococcus pyogenes]
MSPTTCIGSVRSTFQDKQASALACLFLASKPVSLLLCEAFFEHQNLKKRTWSPFWGDRC